MRCSCANQSETPVQLLHASDLVLTCTDVVELLLPQHQVVKCTKEPIMTHASTLHPKSM